jgi:hypothetical protein
MSTKGAQCLSQPPVGDLSADSVRPANSHQPVKRSKIASPIHLSQPAAVLGETTGDEGRSPSIEVGLPRERHVERLEPLGGLPQQTRRPAAGRGGSIDLTPQLLHPGALEIIDRVRVQVGVHGRQGSVRAQSGLGGQRC